VTWGIRIDDNINDLPGGEEIFSVQTDGVGGVTYRPIGLSVFDGHTVTLYEFHAIIPTNFEANANTTYWFSPESSTPAGQPSFYWGPSAIEVDNRHAQETPVNGIPTAEVGDLAFTFIAPGVPEPSAWLMMLAGLGLAGAIVRGERWSQRTVERDPAPRRPTA
jgi:hypothetical protein